LFSRGFIKLYAEFLDLDSQEILERYNRELDQLEDNISDNQDVFFNEKLAESTSLISNRTILLFLLLAVIIGLGYYFFLYSNPSMDHQSSFTLEQPYLADQESKDSAVITSASKTTQGEETISNAGDTSHTSEISPTLDEVKQTDTIQETDSLAGTPTETSLPALNSRQSAQTGAEPAAIREQTSHLDEAENPEDPLAVNAKDGDPEMSVVASEIVEPEPIKKLRLKILFTERTWMQVALDGAAPQQYLFDPAEESSWQADEKIKLHIGNSGGVRLFLDDKELPVGGMSGSPLLLTIPDDLLNN